MSRAVLFRISVTREHGRLGFRPACGVEQVRGQRGSQQAHAVIGVSGAGGVRQENLAVALDGRRAFVDFVADAFP